MGTSEEILGKASKGKWQQVLLSTKAILHMSDAVNNHGASRIHRVKTCKDSLLRFGTDHIDIYLMQGFDAVTPIEETLKMLDNKVQSGKVRYIACSNFSGWHLMKSFSVSEGFGWSSSIFFH